MEMSRLGQGVDAVLSETGIQQCEAVGRYLRDTKFSNVFVSDLKRTVQVKIVRFLVLINNLTIQIFVVIWKLGLSFVAQRGRWKDRIFNINLVFWGMLSEMWQRSMHVSVEEDPVNI